MFGHASFRGIHNRNKGLVMWLLYSEPERWHTALEIASLLSISKRSLFSSLPKWHAWRYVRRKLGNGVYLYSIGSRGASWWKRNRQFAPRGDYQKHVSETKP